MTTPAGMTSDDLMREALMRIEQLQRRVHEYESRAHEPIAIVGLACRFPGAANADQYWRLLREGVDAISEIPRSRWDASAYYDGNPEAAGKVYTRHGGFLEDIDRFDPAFFGISPREAVSLDPQQRLLLETCWHALEQAGIPPAALRGTRGGVFIGIGGIDYYQRLASRAASAIDAYMASGNAHSTAAGRISYLFGLHGPSLAVDTACSSSLVAVHLACQSLRRQECTIALSGGVSVILSPAIHLNHCRSRMLAPDGRCKTFDAAADGFTRSEGVGIVVLKRLQDAERDGDAVLAIICGSAVNQDGRTSALTVPNGMAQQEVIAQALADARVQPGQISYLEAHGTGTSLGDPIEVGALARLFAGRRDRLPIGSVKTNIGHAEAAAGVAGLIKVVLAMQHREIPPHLHFHTPNPRIEWDSMPLRVVTSGMAWGTADERLYAGVSSFGFGGTNAHVVLATPSERVEDEPPLAPGQPLLVLSARTQSALRALAAAYRGVIDSGREDDLPRVLATAAHGRAHMDVRAAFAADDRPALAARLSAFVEGRSEGGCWHGETRADLQDRVVFVYPGQGALRPGMGRALYASNPVFRAAIDRCTALVDPHLRRSLRDVLFGGDDDGTVERTEYAQPAVFALEYALTEVWESLGIRPNVVVGHSVGEFAAACTAGVVSLADACALVVARGRLMQRLGGRMAVLGADVNIVRELMAAGVEIGAINGRNQIVVTGEDTAVSTVVEAARRAGINTAMLPGAVAFHSRAMDAILPEWAEQVRTAGFSAPRCDWVSTVSGREVAGAMDWPHYFARQAREPVAFAEAAHRAWALGGRVFIEVGPSAGLPALVGEAAGTEAADAVWIGGLRAGRGEWEAMRERIAQLYVAGLDVNWRGWDPVRRRRVALPTYPFERSRYWVDAADHKPESARSAAASYSLHWQRVTPAAPSTPLRGSWLICGTTEAALRPFAAAFRDSGVDVITAADGAALDEVLERENGRAIAGVVHVGGAVGGFDRGAAADLVHARVVTLCASAIATLRSMAARGLRTRLWVVTRCAMSFAERADLVAPDAASLWGLGRVLALEHPDAWGGLVDLDEHAPLAIIPATIAAAGDEREFAVARGAAYVARLQPSPAPQGPVALRGDATYLITGGLGALGLRVAERLVACGARHIVLLGRSAPAAVAAGRIAEWRAQGGDVRVEQADVCDRAALARVIDRINSSAAPLRGVLHVAGTNGHQPAIHLDAASLAAVSAAKVAGGWLLHGLTCHLPLDFFVAFSSIASVWGSKGQAHYAAANAFLDALMAHRVGSGLPGRTINWGAWAAGGMVTADADDWLRRVGINPLPAEVALDVLERSLGPGGQQIVADVDWPRFLALYQAQRRHPFFERVIPLPPTTGSSPDDAAQSNHTVSGERRIADTIRAQGAQEGRRTLALLVRDHVVHVLGLTDATAPAPHQGFFSIGFDSLMALELKNRLAAALGVSLPSTIVFDFPSIRALSEHLAGEVLTLATMPASTAEAPTPANGLANSGEMDPAVEAALTRINRLIVT